MKFFGSTQLEDSTTTKSFTNTALTTVVLSPMVKSSYLAMKLSTFSDDYVSWSPKEVFEEAYMQVSDNNTITTENVDNFIARYEDFTIGDKTTVVRAVLVNDFVVVESSSCVDPKNFNQEIGVSICKDRIKSKVWELLGFLLQTAKCGIK